MDKLREVNEYIDQMKLKKVIFGGYDNFNANVVKTPSERDGYKINEDGTASSDSVQQIFVMYNIASNDNDIADLKTADGNINSRINCFEVIVWIILTAFARFAKTTI